MSEIVKELSQRLTPHEMKERAKEVAVRETRELKDRIFDSPLALGVLGGLVTAGLARFFRSRREIGYAPPEVQTGEYRYRGESHLPGEYRARGEDLKERVGEKAHDLKEKAGEIAENVKERAAELTESAKERALELKDKAGQMAQRAAEHVPSGEDVKAATRRVGRYVGDEPLIGALAALAAGAAAGLLLPLTEKEREVLEPYRLRAGETIEQLKDNVKEQMEGLGERLRGEEQEEEKPSTAFEMPEKPTLQ